MTATTLHPATSAEQLANQYAAIGFQVIPLHWPIFTPAGVRCSCGDPRCDKAGKHPHTTNGLKDGTTNPSQITAWWRRWPQANIGIVTGAEAGIVALDVDPRHGGNDSLAALEAEHGQLPPTIEAITGSGGVHLIFRHPGQRIGNSAGRVGQGLDVRGDGGYLVVAPSLHASRRRYSWRFDPWSYEPALLPEWLLVLMAPPPPPPRPPVPPRPYTGRRTPLDRAVLYVRQMPPAISGSGGHKATFRAACACRRFGLSEEEMRVALLVYNEMCDPPWTDAELAHKIADAIRVVPAADVGRKLQEGRLI
ncbi:MAG: bifunctional DNA primase/polymerase [Tepidisphaeraceae bacterium]|jgi:hypothetical protein